MGRRFVMIAIAVGLAACAPPPTPDVPAPVATAAAPDRQPLAREPAPRAPVRFSDGSVLLDGVVSRQTTAGGLLTVEARYRVGEEGERGARIFVWPAGAADPALSQPVPLAGEPAAAGSAVKLRAQVALPAGLRRGNYWVMLSFEVDGEPVSAKGFSSGRVPLGVTQVGMPDLSDIPSGAAPDEAPVLAFAGDLNLGRRQNALTRARGPADALAGVPGLANAELAVVNLECVVAAGGEASTRAKAPRSTTAATPR